MASLDQIRRRFSNATDSEVDRLKGELVVPSITHISVKRLMLGACPGCGHTELQDVGIRHGGTHKACTGCGFEFTDTGGWVDSEGEKKAKLIADAAIRHCSKLAVKRKREEARANARTEWRGKWKLEKLGDGDIDAVLNFGKHAGKRVSELVETREGRGYCRWLKTTADIVREDEDFQEVLDRYLDGTDPVF